jgi:hypothetical protein
MKNLTGFRLRFNFKKFESKILIVRYLNLGFFYNEEPKPEYEP